MEQIEPVTFDSEEEKRVYKQVEQHGPESPDDIREAVGVPADEFETLVTRLTEKNYVEERNGRLNIVLEFGDEEEFETKDFAYTIRPATEDDLDPLVETVQEIAAKKTYVVAEELAEQLRYDDTVTRRNSIQSRVFFVATVDGEIVGWSHLDLPLIEKLRHSAQLTVGVDSSYRGYGIGTHLLEWALDWAESHGYRKVYNNVAKTNMNAISWLESRGWEQEGVRKDHYTIGHKQVDEVMMAYTF